MPTYAYAATVDQLPELTGYVVDDTRAPAEEPAVIVPNTPAIARISAGNAIEGNPLSYIITLTEAPTQPISYPYTTGGTTSPADLGTPVFSNGVTYNSTTGEITVPAGVTNFTVTYPTIDDTQPENPETLVITIGGATGTGTITDNEVPAASPDSATTPEDTPIAGNVLSNDSQIIGTPLQVTQFVIGVTTYPAGSTATITGVGSLVINADGSFIFTPVANYNGPVPVATYNMTDGSSTDSSTLTITVTPQPDTAIVGGAANGATVEDTTLTTGGTLTVTDPDAGEAVFQPQTNIAGAHGSFSIDAAGVWTYTLNNTDPAVQALGAGQTLPNEVFTVQTADGTTAQVTVSITGTDDAPVISAGTGTVVEDTQPSTSGTLTATDIDNPTLAFVPETIVGTYGSLVLQANGQWTYTLDNSNPIVQGLAQGEVVTEPSFTVDLTDGSSTTVNITVTGTNDAPVATPDTASTAINTPINNIPVLPNDTDTDGDPLTVTGAVLTNPAQGTVTVNPDGTLNFTPANNVTGPVEISYTITDGQGGTSTSTVTVTVGNNTNPTGADSVHTILEDTSYTVQIADLGFTDADAGQTLANIRIDSLPAAGSLLLNGNPVTAGAVISAADIAAGNLVLVPVADANGTPYSNFTFSVQDSAGAYDLVPNTLTLNVTPVDDAFVDANEAVSVNEDTTLTGSVLTGTSSVDGAVTVTTFTIAGNATVFNAGQTATIAGVGTLVINSNGSYTFTPVANYNGPVPVATYNMTDGSSTDSSTLTITVNPVDDAFVDANEAVSVNEDTTLTGSVLTGTSSVDGAVTVTTFTIAGNATVFNAGQTATIAGVSTLVINSNGSYTFTPVANYNGPVPVATYNMTDGSSTDSSTLTITVNPVNDAPTVAGAAVTGTEDTPLVLTWANFGVTDVDSANTGLSIRVTTLPANGTLQHFDGSTWTAVTAGTSYTYADINAGNLRFMPALNESGINGNAAGVGNMKADYANFNFTGSDGSLTSSTGTVRIDITPVADAPTLTTADVGFIRQTAFDELTPKTGPNAWTRYVSDLGDGTWQTGNSGGTIESYLEGEYLRNGSNNRVLEIEPNAGSAANFFTNITTVANQVYHLSFDFAERIDNRFTQLTPGYNNSQIDVYWGGVKVATLNTDTIDWTHFEMDLVAPTTGTNTLEFRATDSNSIGGLLDNIVVELTANANGAIILDRPVVSLVDTDGSETLALRVTAIPVGATISDGTNSFTATSGNTTATITTWNLSNLTLLPPAGFTGSITVNYVATSTEAISGSTASSSTAVTVDVYTANTAPSLVNDSITAVRDSVIVGNVLANDSDSNGDTLFVTSYTISGTTYQTYADTAISGVGTFRMMADGDFIFTPVNGWTGSVPTITYTATDEHGSFTTAALNITMNTTGGIFGTGANNTLTGTAGVDSIFGYNGDDTITGVGSNDSLYGGAGNDTITGGAGSDKIYGGAGNDTMTGGIGGADSTSDTFAWILGDRGTTSSPAVDTITDFNNAAVTAGGDVLDLRDLLLNEYHASTNIGEMAQYLHFTVSGGTTTIEVKSEGTALSTFDQKIVLTGVDLSNGGTLATDQAIITDLLARNKIIVD